VLAGLSGDVLEIGGGTGTNLPCFGPAITSLMLIEARPPMLRRLERTAREHRPSAKVLRAPGEDLPFDDHTFDVAVSTLVLCGVDDQPRAWRGAAAGAAPRWPAAVHRVCMRADCPARRGEVMAACSTGCGRAG
jgi:SAM-dependent methyltransferase